MQSRKITKTSICVLFAGLIAAGVLVPRYAGAASCDTTFFSSLGLPNTTFTSAAPQASPAAHCEIIGKINQRTGVDGKPYAIGFHLRLPDAWNQRFYFQGGGGTDGTLGDALGAGALSNGYAVVSTDAGHDNTLDYDANAGGTAAFGADPQARIDYGYNALGQVTQTAKYLIGKYYPKAIAYSYFVGCSNGGRQGMVASQRFPTYFDGIIAGSPGFDLPKAAVAEAWNEQVLAPLATKLSGQGQPYLPDTFSDADLALAANAILAACDDLDGLADGIVGNAAACTNDLVYPELQKIQCTGPKTASCLSAGQVTALKKIYAGVRNSSGKALYNDWQWDAGISGFTSLRLWSLGIDNPGLVNNALNLTLGGGSLPLVFITPPVITPVNALESYIFHFNFDTDAPKIFEIFGPYTQPSMDFMPGGQTDLWDFKQHRGKMILYHGNSDGVFSPHDTIDWYKVTNTAMRVKIQDFARLFLVPGMGHCGGGPGTTQFDTLTPLVNWVEHGMAPNSIVATAPAGTPWPGRTRPLCPYPTIASYGGSGSIEDAANFICVPPVEVSIDPNPLSLSGYSFTANITLPKGFEAKDWGISDVTCNGASATGGYYPGSFYGPTYAATFNTKDLVGVTPGNAVPLNVSLTFHHQGKQASIQASTTVKVVP